MKTNYYTGKHYSAWQVIEVLTDHLQGISAFNAGNVIKYLLRYDSKGQALSDLNKAKHYMDNLVLPDTTDKLVTYYLNCIISDFKRDKKPREYELYQKTLYWFSYAIITGSYDQLETAKYYLERLITYVSNDI